MSDLDEFMIHTAAVESLAGGGPMGNHYADPVGVPCWFEDKRRYVRDAAGAETVSESTLWVLDKSLYELFTPGTIVTHRSRVTTVIGRSLADSGPLGLPDHLQISLE